MIANPATPTPASTRRTSVGGIVLLVLGVLLTLVGAATLAGGVAATASVLAQQRDGYVGAPTARLASGGYALTTPSTSAATGGTIPRLPFDLGRVRVSAEGAQPIFIGIARRADVDHYLAGVTHSEVTDVQYRPFRAQYREVSGTSTPADPAAQTFWTEHASGSGRQQLTWPVQSGDWAVVVMNQDGRAGVSAQVQVGFHTDLLAPIAAAVTAVGLGFLVIGVVLVLLAATLIGRATWSAEDTRDASDGRAVRLTARADEALSRWLWLVKWLLAIPHYVLLAGLWVALLVTSIAAGLVVLFTGRYPRSWFAFAVGVLRWNWRVAFYAYGALGTDRYPPFTLARTDYPADLTVAYPEHLTNGLVLVKSWLLALPHYLVLAALAGGAVSLPVLGPWARSGGSGTSAATGLSVLGVLVLVVGVILLFSGRYPRGVFDLAVGINRWAYRVIVYAALLRDEYPPFRLDQGPDEPAVGQLPALEPSPAV